ncbi:MAG: Methyltransferase type 11 [Acidobacteriaceae bacterium]|nr:Methyltransferase type 11 [Acidobacteriaceae bacterium]
MISTKIQATFDTLHCWNCSAEVTTFHDSSSQSCPHCYAVTGYSEGIWRCLPPEQFESYDRFITEYEFIRAAEGRGSQSGAYYLALPYEDLSGKMSDQWKIRARSFDYIRRHILPRQPQRILDLGAGNGWLSHRLSLLGHSPVAVDLLTNKTDGLGAANHFPAHFPRVQASLDHLPFADSAFDIAIFNASFHYSQDFIRTAAEALRCVRSGGIILIADTPWYQTEAIGQRMVEAKHAHFQTTYGFQSGSIASQEFVTRDRLERIASALHLRWKIYKPFYGIQWLMRPVLAKLRRRRPPSRFHIFLAEKPA